MASEMERALDEILSGVNELLAKAPAGAPVRPRPQRRPITEDDPNAVLSALAYLESEPSHLAGKLARRLMTRFLEQRAMPLGFAGSEFSHITVSPIMHRAVRRLHLAGGRLAHCRGAKTFWDCSLLSKQDIHRALGRLYILAQPDSETGYGLIGLPRIPERLYVIAMHDQDHWSSDKPDRVVLADQDNPQAGQMATVFWLEQARHAPKEVLGGAIVFGRPHLLVQQQGLA